MCEDYLSINNQLELIKNWRMKPDFIINLKVNATVVLHPLYTHKLLLDSEEHQSST